MSITARWALSLVLAFTLAGAVLAGPSDAAQNAGQPSSVPSGAAKPGGAAGADKPATYVGNEVCKACHSKDTREFAETMMGKVMMLHARDDRERLGCESCHGPGSKHAAAGGGKGVGGLISFRKGVEPVKLQNDKCLQCHEKGQQAFWRASTHAFREVACVDCHTIMRKVSPEFQLAGALQSNPFLITRPETQVCLSCHPRQRTEINLPSHMPLREGSMACTDCHNPHGGPYPKMLKGATANETCYFCHAEKRGPWLWMHPPVAQNCLTCHDPHGSINRFMLTVRPPRLCQQCHVAEHAGSPYRPGTYYVFSRACLNCHFHIHGSNSPGGWALTR